MNYSGIFGIRICVEFCNFIVACQVYIHFMASVFALVDKVIVSSSLSCFNNRILRSASKALARSEMKLKTLAVCRVYRSSLRAPAKQVFPSYRARIVFRCNKDSVSLEGWATFAPWKRTSSPSPD